MTATMDGLHAALRTDFDLGCVDLAEARRLRAEEDTLAHRNAVSDACARIDAILDMHLGASASA